MMIDYVGTCGNQLLLRQTDVLPFGSFGFLRVLYGSYGPCKLQVLILQETRQAIGEERWTQTRKAFLGASKMIRQTPLFFQAKIR